jgi:hypothetical protein
VNGLKITQGKKNRGFYLLIVNMPVELNLGQRMQVLHRIDEGYSYNKIMDEFGIAKGTITKIKASRASLEQMVQENANTSIMRTKRLKNNAAELDMRVYEWFSQARSRGICITGPMIKEKATISADHIGMDGFKASNGWLECFQKRHNISWRAVSGESNNMPSEVVKNWKTNIMTILAGYSLRDIFNCDKTGLFWRALPNKTLAEKGDLCIGGKLAKERLTVMLTVSALGEKERLLVIGKAQMPRCFGGKTPPGIIWKANSKAWMNSQIFEDFLNEFNSRMRSQTRHVILLLDNAPCHPHIQLSNVKLVFFPPNTTAGTQPLDAGIIKNLKVLYRKRFLSFLVSKLDEGPMVEDFVKSVTISQSIAWLKAAWCEINTSSIANCFNHCGLYVNESPPNFAAEPDNKIELLSLAKAVGIHDFMSVEEVQTYEVLGTDWEASVLKPEIDRGDEDHKIMQDGNAFTERPTWSVAYRAWQLFKSWHDFEQQEELDELVDRLDSKITQIATTKINNSKITDYFKVVIND